MLKNPAFGPYSEVNDNLIIGYIDGDRVIQLRVEGRGIVTDTSSCLPVRFPEQYIELYSECLEKARALKEKLDLTK